MSEFPHLRASLASDVLEVAQRRWVLLVRRHVRVPQLEKGIKLADPRCGGFRVIEVIPEVCADDVLGLTLSWVQQLVQLDHSSILVAPGASAGARRLTLAETPRLVSPAPRALLASLLRRAVPRQAIQGPAVVQVGEEKVGREVAAADSVAVLLEDVIAIPWANAPASIENQVASKVHASVEEWLCGFRFHQVATNLLDVVPLATPGEGACFCELEVPHKTTNGAGV